MKKALCTKIKTKYPVVLASSSPQRQTLLQKIIENSFIISPHEIDENAFSNPDPVQYATILAREKALDVFSRHPESLVIAGDTVVACQGKSFGKPKDRQEAKQFIEFLVGKEQYVTTGVALRWPKGFRLFSETSKVLFKKLSSQEIEDYLDTNEWQERAGGYAIHLSAKMWVERLEGNIENVIGLPIQMLQEALKDIY